MALTEPIVHGSVIADNALAQPVPAPFFATNPAATPVEQRNPEVARILGLTVPCSVILAQRDMSIQSILAITVGTIIEFNVPFDADLTLYIANRSIARGQAIKVGENFGIRIHKIDSIEHRIDALAGR